MTIGIVLGNGRSRRAIKLADLTELKGKAKIYGCNALYRDFIPDVLVATDTPIATEIQNLGYALKNDFYTRYPIDGLGAKNIPVKYFGYSSGPIAVALAAAECDIIFMIGFDMGSKPGERFNNVYAGSNFYKKGGSSPTFGGNWNKQLVKIIESHPDTVFFRVQDKAHSAKFELTGPHTNVTTMDIQDSLLRLNKL